MLLSNSDTDLSAIGTAILEDRALNSIARAQPGVSRSDVRADDYVGLYQVRGGIEIVVREHEQRLYAQPQGDQAAVLSALGDDVFDAGPVGFTISFQREAGQVRSLLFGHDGINLLAERLSARAPHVARAEIPLAAEQLAEFAGDFRVAPATIARISPVPGGLSMQLTGRTPLRLVAFARDRFACADQSCELSFVRDADGAVTRLTIDFAGGQHDATRVRWSTP